MSLEKELAYKWKTIKNLEKKFLEHPSRESAERIVGELERWVGENSSTGIYMGTASAKMEVYSGYIEGKINNAEIASLLGKSPEEQRSALEVYERFRLASGEKGHLHENLPEKATDSLINYIDGIDEPDPLDVYELEAEKAYALNDYPDF